MASNIDLEAELRQEMKTITDNMIRETEFEISLTQNQLYGMSAEELNAYLDDKVKDLKDRICRKANELQTKVKSYMPSSETKRETAEYQRKLENFRSLVGMVSNFVSSFSNFVDSIMNKVAIFFRKLWDLIRQAIDIAKSIYEFVSSVRNMVSSWWSSIFG